MLGILEAHAMLCMTAGFFENNIFAGQMGKIDQAKFFECINISLLIIFFLNLVCNESLY